ncbi:hypothetical protein ACFQZ0_12020 [Streptomyces erythrogriseus]
MQCVQPGVGDTIIDPACGTGGFLTKSFEYLVEHFPPASPLPSAPDSLRARSAALNSSTPQRGWPR